MNPVKVFSPGPDIYIFDLGEIITGNIELKIPDDLSAGDRIVFRHSEELQTNPDGTKNLGIFQDKLWYPESLRAKDRSQYISYRHGMGGFHTWTTHGDLYVVGNQGPTVWRSTQQNTSFRYVEVIGLKKPPQPGDFTGLLIHSDLQRVGTFECSEPAFNRFNELCEKTLMMCSRGIVTDNWSREMNNYNWDWNKVEFGHYVYDIHALMRLKADGNGISARAFGQAGWAPGGHQKGSAAGSGTLVYGPWLNRDFVGEGRIVEENFDAFLINMRTWAKQLDENRHLDADEPWGEWQNYPHNHSGEWLAAQSEEVKKSWGPKTPKSFSNSKVSITERTFLANAVLCDMARRIAVFAAELGREPERQEMQALHEKMKAGLNKVYFKEEALSYAAHPDVAPNGSDSLDALAFYAGIVPEALREKIARRMVADLKKRDYQMTTGVLSTVPYLRLLSDYGFAEEAYAMFAREGKYGIKHMLRMCPDGVPEEVYVDQLNNMWSRAQSDSVGFGHWFWYGLGGLRADPAHPGMKHFTFAPQIPTKMAWAKIAHESPYGNIISSWKRDGDRVRWEVTVPPNSTATALIPTSDATTIREAGKLLQEAGLAALPGDNGTFKIELPSGSYVFDFAQMAPQQTTRKE